LLYIPFPEIISRSWVDFHLSRGVGAFWPLFDERAGDICFLALTARPQLCLNNLPHQK
jgi:hypothetical protein